MASLLTFRDNIKAFFSRYDYILTPIVKGILAFIIFLSIKQQFGSIPILDSTALLFLLACVCAFLPVELIVAIGSIMLLLQSLQISLDAALVLLALMVIFYCGYMRLLIKTGIIVLLVPLFYSLHLIYALPILLGFLVGPAAIIPAMFGILLYFYVQGLGELVNVLATATEDDTVQGYQFMLNLLITNKWMFLSFLVFACVILITYIIYRSSFEHSWLTAFCAGGFLNVVLFLVGSVTLSVEVPIVPILLGSVAGVLIALVIQFWKGIVDYQRTELLQYEDDEYYYYVKAIPKLSVSESNKNVKRINSKTHN